MSNFFLLSVVLVNALWREGRTEEAIMAVEEMERRGIVGNASLYYDLARCLCSVGRCTEALKLVRIFKCAMHLFLFLFFFLLSIFA